MTSCISPSSTKVFFKKERHIAGSLVKLKTLSENTPGICQTYWFSFFSVMALQYLILFFVFCGNLNNSSFLCLTLKRLREERGVGVGVGGGSVNLTALLCGFLKSVSSKQRVKPWLFVTFKIIIRHIFSFRSYGEFLLLY